MLIMSSLSCHSENSCDQCDFVLAFESLYDSVIKFCLYGGFRLGGSKKMKMRVSYLFPLLEQRAELWNDGALSFTD